jgi:hypothetical protein
MDIDLTTGDWAIPRASEVQYASFWFDGEQPEEASLRRVPKPKDLRVLADLEWARLQAEGWHCRTLRDVPGQGLAAGCAKTGQRHHVLTVTDLRGDGWVGFAPQHDHHAPHNP